MKGSFDAARAQNDADEYARKEAEQRGEAILFEAEPPEKRPTIHVGGR